MGRFKAFSRENGFFVFRFGEDSDCLRVFENGSWYFKGRLLVLKGWESDATCEQDMINTIPIWLKLPNLPIPWCSQRSISIIASTIGKPLYVDSATELRGRLSYARCCVEVSIEDDLKDSVPLYEEGKSTPCMRQQVIYDWKPQKCMQCMTFGHTERTCQLNRAMKEGGERKLEPMQNKKKNIWMPKYVGEVMKNDNISSNISKYPSCTDVVTAEGKMNDVIASTRSGIPEKCGSNTYTMVGPKSVSSGRRAVHQSQKGSSTGLS